MSLTVAGLFSGIGGFTLAAERCGLTPVWECEIDPFARRVLRARWPEVPLYDDVRAIDPAAVGGPDILTFGFPCQDLSVAGKRAGLGGERSGLFWEAIRLADALRPPWLVAENVPGLLSSDGGSDMGVVIGALRDLGYLGAWRVLDAQWCGVAQRRRRVFIVGCLGEQRLAALLPFLASGNRHPAPRRTAGEGAAGIPGGGSGSRGWCDDRDRAGAFIPMNGGAAPALTARQGKGGFTDPVNDGVIVAPVAPALSRSNPYGDHESREGLLVCVDMQGGKGDGRPSVGDTPTLGADTQVHAVCFNWQARMEGPQCRRDGSPSLRRLQTPAVAFTERTRADGRNLEVLEEQAYCLTNPGSGGRTHSRQVMSGSQVRRLTPTECERLQGFPDGHTCLCGKNSGRSVAPEGAEPCSCPDGPRYRALGNAVAVPVAEWVLRCVRDAEEAACL